MYSNTDILDAISRKDIIISPYSLKQLQTNSYDLRLGNTFYEVFWDDIGPYFIGPYVYLDGEKITIPTGGTLLGVTKERVGTFGKVVAELRSKSTVRRVGITTNCDAGLGDVGYNNMWTLELSGFVGKEPNPYNGKTYSHNKFSRPFLKVGDTIAQMVFYECKSEPFRKYSGQYQVEWPLNMIPKQYRDRVIAPKLKL